MYSGPMYFNFDVSSLPALC